MHESGSGPYNLTREHHGHSALLSAVPKDASKGAGRYTTMSVVGPKRSRPSSEGVSVIEGEAAAQTALQSRQKLTDSVEKAEGPFGFYTFGRLARPR